MRCPETTEKKTRQKKEKTIKFTPEEAKSKVDEILAVKTKKREEKLKTIGKQKTDKDVSTREQFIILEREHLPILFTIKRLRGPLSLYLYLRTYVNRKPTARFANLGKYFNEGYLATARTQSWLKRELGVAQSTFSFWFSILESEGMIVPIAVEYIQISKTIEPVTVYALGELRDIDGYTQEIWYIETL